MSEFEETVDPLPEPDDRENFWVFAYGSLMWNPGFDYQEKMPAKLYGYHRSLCIWSWYYRGTQEDPGLVLGLDIGGSCHGMAFRVNSNQVNIALTYLHEREMINNVYLPVYRRVHVSPGETVNALTFIVRPGHPQYAGKIQAHRAAQTVNLASGQRGLNKEYVNNTISQLNHMGLEDRKLFRIQQLMVGMEKQ